MIMAICITVIEYIAGLIFIKGMNIKLWDYSDQWGNVQGIICPLFSFFWLLLSATYYFFIHPYILNSLDWLAQNLCFFLYYWIFSSEFLYWIWFIRCDWYGEFDCLQQNIRLWYDWKNSRRTFWRAKERNGEKRRFLFAFRSGIPLKEHLERYLDTPSVKAAVERLAGTDAEERKSKYYLQRIPLKINKTKKNGKQFYSAFRFFL